MEQLAIGFWGCYFGATGLMLAGSIFAFIRSLRQVAFNIALTSLAAAFFVLAFLGALPIENEATLERFLAVVASLVSAFLAYLFFATLGLLREPEAPRRTIVVLAAVAAAVIVTGWLMPPRQALAAGIALAFSLGTLALALSLRRALHDERLGWVTVFGVSSMLVVIAGLGWIALDRARVPWQVHAVSALAATAYLASISVVLWTRYSYVIELREVMAQGPDYDPVTRMRSRGETGQMMDAAFMQHQDPPAPLGLIVVSIANLYALEKLYGQAAVNHALFVCAGRLRRVVPAHVEMGRVAADGFLLLKGSSKDSGRLIRLARTVQACLSKSMVLNTRLEGGTLGYQKTRWAAEVGVGVLRISQADEHAAVAVAKAQGMSRTAWSYPSRLAWYDEKSLEIVELPVLAS
ncbi:MAG: diguanylate cyclase domain-containing protein [Polaromonas sp.]